MGLRVIRAVWTRKDFAAIEKAMKLSNRVMEVSKNSGYSMADVSKYMKAEHKLTLLDCKRYFNADEKAYVCSLTNEYSLGELARRYKLNPSTIHHWTTNFDCGDDDELKTLPFDLSAAMEAHKQKFYCQAWL